MKRREFISLLGGLAAWPVGASAQQSIPTIGYMTIVSDVLGQQIAAAFRLGLRQGGLEEGRNVAVEYRFAAGKVDKLPGFAQEFASRPVSVIAALGGSRSAVAAKAATSKIPIVFTMGDADPVQLGVVDSLARPGGNVTGVSLLGGLLGAKRVELLRELVPSATRVGVLINPENRSATPERQELETALRQLGQEGVVVLSGPADDLEAAMSSFLQQRVQAIVVTADPIFTSRRSQLIALCAKHRIPAIYQWKPFVSDGGLISYGTDLGDGYRLAGAYTARIIRGERPGDLPVVQPTKFELAINLKAARTLGLEVPPTLLARADEVIE